MLRLYQWLHRRASLLLFAPSNLPVPVTSRRVVTMEWEERVLLLRPRSPGQSSPGDCSGPEEGTTETVATDDPLTPRVLDKLDDQQLRPKALRGAAQQGFLPKENDGGEPDEIN